MQKRAEHIRSGLAEWEKVLRQYDSFLEFQLSQLGQHQAAISRVLDGPAFVGDNRFGPREGREDSVGNRCLSPPERMAAFLDDTH